MTKLHKNMKNRLLLLLDKLLLRSRAIIENAFDFLKKVAQVEHTRHRSPQNFLVNLTAALLVYSLEPHQPALDLTLEELLLLQA